MAATATDVWEFRATAGSANAGGGYDSAAGTTDYSNQDSAQLQLTDLATPGAASTTLTSATGGFTAAMVGNYIQIRSGTNFDTGFYRVTVRTDTNTVTLDRTASSGGAGASGSGDLGGALDILTDAFIDDVVTVIAGNIIYIKNDGTMTMAAVTAAKDGVLGSYITIDGYNTTRGDNPTGSNRPTLAFGAAAFNLDNYWSAKNLIVTTTSATGLGVDVEGKAENCFVTNSSGSGGRDAFNAVSGCSFSRCEGVSTNGNAIEVSSTSNFAIGCYLHDSNQGIEWVGADRGGAINCVIDTCTTGINAGNNCIGVTVVGNTFYNNTTAISTGTGNTSWNIANNIFDANTTGISWGETSSTVYMDYNVWDNTTDVTNVVKGDHAITGDPALGDPANGDFTLDAGSNAIDAGLDAADAGATV